MQEIDPKLQENIEKLLKNKQRNLIKMFISTGNLLKNTKKLLKQLKVK